MTMVDVRRSTATGVVDVRRLGLATVDGDVRPLALPLALAARLAEADRVLPDGLRLLVLDDGDGDGFAVDVVLADRRGDPVWMGAIPALLPGRDGPVALAPVALAPERGADGDRSQRTIREALVAVGLTQDPAVWFRWAMS